MSIAAGRLMENAYGGVSQVIERETACKQEQEAAEEVEET